MRYRNLVMSVMVVLFSLVGCVQKSLQPIPQVSQSELAKIKHLQIAHKLDAQGVQIIHVGETVTIVLPSDTLFNPHSANLTDAAQPLLSNVADFLKYYAMESVQVTSYIDEKDGSTRFKEALTRRQAEVVTTSLWNAKIDARIVYPEGLGGHYPVSTNQEKLNRRVEISFNYFSKP